MVHGADPRTVQAGFATIVSNLALTIQLDQNAGNSDRGQTLEKLEEAPPLTHLHGRAEPSAHRKLTEIKVFASPPLFDYGSTGIIETL